MGLYFWVKDWLTRPALNLGSRLLLSPLALAGWVYARVQASRRWLYRRGFLPSYRPGVPVISIGNVTAGGTGKTPCVQTVCRKLLEMGVRPAVLSRGYRGSLEGKAAVVSDGTSILLDAEQAGDEPVLLARSLPGVPVLVGSKRRATSRLAVARYGAEALVLDDGFQHLQLARDVDLITVDARLPFGNGHCFPRGLLRESPRALRDADVVLITRSRRVEPARAVATREAVRRHADGKPVLLSRHAPVELVELPGGRSLPLSELQGRKVLAVAGIGQPEVFFEDLRALGAEVLQKVPLPDHHRFQADDVVQIVRWARLMNADLIVTTEKDGVRLNSHLPLDTPVWALRIAMQVEGEEILWQVIADALGDRLEHQGPGTAGRGRGFEAGRRSEREAEVNL